MSASYGVEIGVMVVIPQCGFPFVQATNKTCQSFSAAVVMCIWNTCSLSPEISDTSKLGCPLDG